MRRGTATQSIYIDVLFLMNFLMDTVLLWTLKRILRLKSSPLKLFSGGAAGAAWACLLATFPQLPAWAAAAGTYGAAGGLMLWLAFSPGSLRELAREMLSLYFLAAVFGGVGAFLYWHTPAGYFLALAARGDIRGAAPAAVFLLLVAGAGFSLLLFQEILKGRKGNLYQVTLFYQGKQKEVTALLDTGNHLFEPVSRKPVSVLSRRAAQELCGTVRGIIYVPYRSVGKEHGLLAAVKMDAMEIRREELYLRIEAPLVGLSKETLSEDGSFDLLLNEKLFH